MWEGSPQQCHAAVTRSCQNLATVAHLGSNGLGCDTPLAAPGPGALAPSGAPTGAPSGAPSGAHLSQHAELVSPKLCQASVPARHGSFPTSLTFRRMAWSEMNLPAVLVPIRLCELKKAGKLTVASPKCLTLPPLSSSQHLYSSLWPKTRSACCCPGRRRGLLQSGQAVMTYEYVQGIEHTLIRLDLLVLTSKCVPPPTPWRLCVCVCVLSF